MYVEFQRCVPLCLCFVEGLFELFLPLLRDCPSSLRVIECAPHDERCWISSSVTIMWKGYLDGLQG